MNSRPIRHLQERVRTFTWTSTRAMFRIAIILALALASICVIVSHYLINALGKGHQSGFAAVGKGASFFAEHAGPTGVKLAQIISARRDLFDPRCLAPLERLCDTANVPSKREVLRTFRSAFPNEPGERLLEIDCEPIASGSVSFVLRARTIRNEDIAIKFLRKNVKEKILIDIAISRLIIKLVSIFPATKSVPLEEIFNSFSSILIEQCDMRIEARNMIDLSPLLEIRIPILHDDLIEETSLGMEYINIRSRISSEEIPDSDFRSYALFVLREVYNMVFVHGIIHGDIHPGNVVLDDRNNVVLIDFGLVVRINQIDRRRLRCLFFGVITGDFKLVSSVILESASSIPREINTTLFEASVERLVSTVRGVTVGDFLVTEFAYKLFEIQRRFGLRGAPSFANAIWVLAMYEGLVRARFPSLAFQSEALSILMKPYHNQSRSVLR
ncbi:AarF/UbiB family protein [Neorhizobium sp. T25_13]|uniref:AarF/UbiB family protein n=1 Tax=Neorhizobium sp. T25_13 TaxID=2093830 RepID=UPI00155E0443|nr:AarF/UbiB family protein [Neorhizobium sp. T25_13]